MTNSEEIHERLSVIDVKRDLRNKIRKLKGDQTYDKFLRELISIYAQKEESK